jgi:hypothetical protein
VRKKAVHNEEEEGSEDDTKIRTTSYDLPPSVIQTGDVHVLKGFGSACP